MGKVLKAKLQRCCNVGCHKYGDSCMLADRFEGRLHISIHNFEREDVKAAIDDLIKQCPYNNISLENTDG